MPSLSSISIYTLLQCVDTDDFDKHVGRGGVAVRTPVFQSNLLAALSKCWQFSSSHVATIHSAASTNIRAAIAACLNASKRSQDSDGMSK